MSAFLIVVVALPLWLGYLLRPAARYRHNDFQVAAITSAILSLSLIAHLAGNLAEPSVPSGWSLDSPMFLKGARIIDAWTSPTYTPYGVNLFAEEMRNLHVEELVRHSHGPVSIPEIAIGLYIDPRALWFFADQHATMTVALPQPVRIDSVRLKGHSTQRCLPRDVNVWGVVSLSTANKIKLNKLNRPSIELPPQLRTYPNVTISVLRRALLGPAPMWLPLSQIRDVPRGHCDNDYAVDDVIVQHGIAVHAVALEFRRNWGNDYSCFPGLGISGSVA